MTESSSPQKYHQSQMNPVTSNSLTMKKSPPTVFQNSHVIKFHSLSTNAQSLRHLQKAVQLTGQLSLDLIWKSETLITVVCELPFILTVRSVRPVTLHPPRLQPVRRLTLQTPTVSTKKFPCSSVKTASGSCLSASDMMVPSDELHTVTKA